MASFKQKKLRGFSRGVTPNRAVRMITMAAPICPNSKVEVEIRDGRAVPKGQDPSKPNCQAKAWDKPGYPWWEDCQKAGHDPYYTKKFYTVSEPVYEDQDGEKILTGMKTVYKEDKYLNTVQVATGTRHNSGQGYRRAVKMKGRKPLPELGHEEVCQFRNCQEPVDYRYRSKRFGDYCSEQHYVLVAANEQEEALTQVAPSVNGPDAGRIARKREAQLRQAGAFGLDG